MKSVQSVVIEKVSGMNHKGIQPRMHTDDTYVFRQVVARDNVIRHPVGVADPPGLQLSRGFVVVSVEKALIESNVIDLEAPNQILWRHIGSMRLFNNHTSGGKLVDGYDDTGTIPMSDRARDVEDAWLLAF